MTGKLGIPRDSNKGMIGTLGIPRDSKQGMIGSLETALRGQKGNDRQPRDGSMVPKRELIGSPGDSIKGIIGSQG